MRKGRARIGVVELKEEDERKEQGGDVKSSPFQNSCFLYVKVTHETTVHPGHGTLNPLVPQASCVDIEGTVD